MTCLGTVEHVGAPWFASAGAVDAEERRGIRLGLRLRALGLELVVFASAAGASADVVLIASSICCSVSESSSMASKSDDEGSGTGGSGTLLLLTALPAAFGVVLGLKLGAEVGVSAARFVLGSPGCAGDLERALRRPTGVVVLLPTDAAGEGGGINCESVYCSALAAAFVAFTLSRIRLFWFNSLLIFIGSFSRASSALCTDGVYARGDSVRFASTSSTRSLSVK